MKTIIIVGVIVVICFIVFAVREEKKYQRYLERKKRAEEHAQFERDVKQIADQMLQEMHTGCMYKGCCVFDMTQKQDEAQDTCYCTLLHKTVNRHSPCEHFMDRKPPKS